MNIGDLITEWKKDYTWIKGVPNFFLKKDVVIWPNPANNKEVLLFCYVEDNTVFVDGNPLPYFKHFDFQTFGQSGTQEERDGDAKRFKDEIGKFMKGIIQEREEQLCKLEKEGKEIKVTNPLLWK